MVVIVEVIIEALLLDQHILSGFTPTSAILLRVVFFYN